MRETIARRARGLRHLAVLLLSILLVVLLVVDACGGDDDDRASGTPASGPFRDAVASRFDDYDLPLACGGVLGRAQQGVAHKTLPCGTRITIEYRGRRVVVPVIDRGPYVAGREFDLAGATANTLGFGGVHVIRVSP